MLKIPITTTLKNIINKSEEKSLYTRTFSSDLFIIIS
nr:MAG TPA: hypothetical protein [Caudoviricetes sp.]